MKTIEPGWRPEYRDDDSSLGDAGPGSALAAPSSPGARAKEGYRA